MSWTAAIVIWLWDKRSELHKIKKYISIYCAVIGLIFLYGIVMLQSIQLVESSVRMAAVTVPVSHLLNELFIKTEKEAQADAKIVFWSELNGAVLKEDEAELLQRASDIAKEQDIYLLVSLLVKTPYQDLKENKVVAFSPQGHQILEYLKYGRSIGELCIKGDGELKSFNTEYGRIAPFICSDMAFSAVIRQAGEKDVDILIVPASDWKEMTPIAVKTAVIRGVENGCNIIRHTNKGISAVSDTRGNILALADYFESDTKTISAQVITSGRFTLYSQIGDVLVYLCGLYLFLLFIDQICFF